MPAKNKRRFLKNQQKRTSRLIWTEKLNTFLKITIAVLIAGGMFGAGYISGARPALPESASSSETVPESDISPETSSSTPLPNNSYLPEIPRINVYEVKKKLDAGSNIVIVDSRHTTEYEAVHIVGAISIPEEEMSEPYSNLDSYDWIITYCN